MASVVKRDSGCWEWIASTRRGGYGQLTYHGRPYTAHRASYEVHKGTVPDGLLVLHKCDNRSCVNPDHLYAGTYVDNRRDMLERSGWKHPFRQRTECFAGHPYTEGSYGIAKDGSRTCRQCMREHQRRYRLMRKKNGN